MNNMFITPFGEIWYQQIDKQKPKNLLLIHGFMEDHEVWNNLIPSLEANIILIDLLGFGKSKPSDEFDFSMVSHAKSIHLLLQHLNLSQIHVIGHSMGGYIALELSLLQPDLHMGLLHSTCMADSDERKINRNRTIEVLQKDASVFIREFYWNLFAEHRKTAFTTMVEELKSKANQIPVLHIIKTVMALRDRNDNQSTWMNLVNTPLMIAGTYDKLIDFQDVKRLASLKHAMFGELTNAGHMGFYEEPENLIKHMHAWI